MEEGRVLPAGYAHPHASQEAREKRHLLVDSLPDEQADELLRLATNLYAMPEPHPALPAFVGIGASGGSDGSERADEFLDGFGR